MKIDSAKIYVTLLLLIGLLPSFGAIDPDSSHWFAISILNTAALIDIFFYKKEQLTHNKSQKMYLLLFAFFTLIALVSMFFALNFSESVKAISKIITTLVTLTIIFHYLKDKKNWLAYIITISCIYSAYIGLKLIDLFIGKKHLARSLVVGHSRLNFGNENITATVLTVLLPFIIYGVFSLKGYKKTIAFIAFFLSSMGIFLISSKTALATSAILLSFYFVFMVVKNKSIDKKWGGLFLILLAVAFIGVNVNRYSPNKANTFEQMINGRGAIEGNTISGPIIEAWKDPYNSIGIRLKFDKNAIENIKNRPFTGYGIGNYKATPKDEVNILYNTNAFKSPLHTHNDILEIGVDTGILGVCAFLSLFIFLLFQIIKLFKRKDVAKEIPLFLLLALMAYTIDMLLNFPFSRASNTINLIAVIALITFLVSKEVDFNSYNSKFKNLLKVTLITLGFGILFLNYTIFNAQKVNSEILTDYTNNHFHSGKKFQFSYDYAKENLNPFFEINEKGITNEHILGNYAMSENKNELAHKHFDKSIKILPNNYSSNMYKGILFKKTNPDSAIYFAKQGIAKRPYVRNNHIVLVDSYLDKKDTLNFLKSVRNFLDFYPKEIDYYKKWVIVSLANKKNTVLPSLAIVKGIYNNPNNKILENISNVIYFSKSLNSTDDTLANLLFKNGLLKFSERNFKDAEMLFNKAIELGSKKPIINYYLAMGSFELKNHEEVIKRSTILIESQPEYKRDLCFLRAKSYEALKKYAKAKADYLEAKKQGNPFADYKLSILPLN